MITMGETPSLLSTTSPLHLSDTTFTPRASRASCECMVCSYILKLFWFLSRYRWALPLIPKSSKVISYNKIISSSQKASQWSVALSLLQQLQQQLLPSIVSCCAAVAACRVERSGWRRAAGMVLEIRKKQVEVNASLGGHENGWMFREYAYATLLILGMKEMLDLYVFENEKLRWNGTKRFAEPKVDGVVGQLVFG